MRKIQGRHVAGGLAGTAVTTAMVVAIAHWTAPRTAPFEGFVPCAYVDRIGRGHPLTIGYGHTGPDVRRGQCVTHAQGVALLEKDEAIAARKTAACSPAYVVANRYLWGAATDFALNTGYYCRGPNGRPTTMALLFAADRPGQACDFYLHYVFSAGKVQNGLVRRRRFFTTDCMKGVTP